MREFPVGSDREKRCAHPPRLYAPGLSLSLSNMAKMWTVLDGLRRRAHLMKSCARQKHKAAALPALELLPTLRMADTCGICGVARNFSTTYICGELYALNFFGTFRPMVRSIFAPRALCRCNARAIKKEGYIGFCILKHAMSVPYK